MNVLDNYQSILLERFNPRVGGDLLTIEGERHTITSLLPFFRKMWSIDWIHVLPYTPDVLPAYRWLLCYQWTQSQQKFQQELASGKVSV